VVAIVYDRLNSGLIVFDLNSTYFDTRNLYIMC